MVDFLTFEKFISSEVLLVFYYMGLFFLPILMWMYRKKVSFVYRVTQSENRTVVLIVLLLIFIVMQIFWRMMFEAMIAYFDMHDYLQLIVEELQSKS